MPKVPEEQQAQFNTSNIPGVMFPFGQQFGKIGEATEKVGNAIEQGASTYNEVQNRLNTLQATEDATNAHASFKMWATQYQTNLKLQAPDGFIHEDPTDPTSPRKRNADGLTDRSMVDEAYDAFNKRYQEDQDGLSPQGKRIYRESILPFISNETAMLSTETQATQAKAMKENASARSKAQGALYENTPRFSQQMSPSSDAAGNPIPSIGMVDALGKPMQAIDASKFYSNHQKMITDTHGVTGPMGIYNSQEAQMAIKENGETMANEAGRNMLLDLRQSKKTNDPDKVNQIMGVVNFLKGEDPQSMSRKAAGDPKLPIFSDIINPDKRDAMIHEALGYLPQAKKEDFDNDMHTWELEVKNAKNGDSSSERVNGVLKLLMHRADVQPEHAVEMIQKGSELAANYVTGLHNSPLYYMKSQAMRDSIAAKDIDEATKFTQDFVGAMKRPWNPAYAAEIKSAVTTANQKISDDIVQEQRHDMAEFAMRPREGMGFKGQSVLDQAGKLNQLDLGRINVGTAQAHQQWVQANNQYESMAHGAWGDHPENYRMLLAKENSPWSTQRMGQVMNDESATGMSQTQKASLIKSWQIVFRKDFSTAMDTAIFKDKTLNAQYLVAGRWANDPRALSYAMSMIGGGTTEDKTFKDKLESGSSATVKTGDVAAAATAKLDDFLQAKFARDPLNVHNAIVREQLSHVLQTATMHEMRAGNLSSVSDATDLAYSKLFGNYGKVVTSGNSFFGTSQPKGDNNVSKNFFPAVVNGKPVSDETINTVTKNAQDNAQNIEKFHPVDKNGQPFNELQLNDVKKSIKPIDDVGPGGDGRGYMFKTKQGYDSRIYVLNSQGKPTPLFHPIEGNLDQPRPGKPGTGTAILNKFMTTTPVGIVNKAQEAIKKSVVGAVSKIPTPTPKPIEKGKGAESAPGLEVNY